ncbi:hypothetical protein BH23VER1_BH23VER1_22740 [soil metagenome]
MMMKMNRRSFLGSAVAAGVGSMLGRAGSARAAEGSRPLALGFDNFSLRALGWKADRLLDYAAEQQCDCILFSDLDVYESHEDAYLQELRAKADGLGVMIYAGTGGISPHAHRFNDKWGGAQEHLRLAIRVAHALGSPALRCYQGFAQDRSSEGGIRARIAETVEILQSVKGEAVDAGVKIAVENHAGDMQAHELRDLIEAAGPEFVGATIDSGNATWTLEDPVTNLQILAPYAACTGIRDSMIWEDDEGAVVQWTAVGDGCVDMKKYFEEFAKLCPETPVIMEIISGFARPFPYFQHEFWDTYQEVKAWEFARFVELAKAGNPIEPFQPAEGEDNDEAQRRYQQAELERSLAACREKFGLGRRG